MSDEQRLQEGLESFNKVYSGIIEHPGSTDATSFAGMTLSHLFRDVWARDKLPMRERRFIVLSVLAGLGADPSLFEIHARAALRNKELDIEDLRELVVTVLYYVGYPKASPLAMLVEKLAAEARGMSGETA